MLEIKFTQKDKTFYLGNGNISYVFSVEKEGYLMHRYFGKYIRNYRGCNRPYFYDRGFCSNPVPEDRSFSLDTLPREFPDMNQGDFRSPAYVIQTEDGRRVSRFVYKDHKIMDGKPELMNLPAVYVESGQEAETLCVTLADAVMQAEICLYYTIFEKYDAICRHVEVVNHGQQELYLERLMSMSLDLPGNAYDVLTLCGSHTKEKGMRRRPLLGDSVIAESIRGTSSPQSTPFLALMEKHAGEDHGEVWAFNYVYSGDFQAAAQAGQYQSVRVQMGMNPLTFGWRLEKNERFVTPETVMVYSASGLGGMSRVFHDLYRKCLCRGFWREKERPILLNSWEAFEFDVNEDNCLELAKEAGKLGMELFVLDDGWFKNRVSDEKALGDWTADSGKFPHGLKHLAEKIVNEGIGFGLWFEPEMISPDSDLYRRHPEWAVRSPSYEPVLSRSQYVLDLSNPEVCSYVLEAVSGILQEVPVSYVKWDMNRHLTDLGSSWLDSRRQRELSHRYVLGLYGILEELNRRFPKVLFEGCSSGGGRFDAGMLYYMPQTWASDNTDAVCRMEIQYGTSLVFPPVTMGAHVSVVPNHQVGRITPLETRFAAAMSGSLGYEMDLRCLSDEEKGKIKKQTEFYKQIRGTIQKGDFYRILNPQEGNEAAWNFVSADGEQVVFFYAKILSQPADASVPVKLKGLDEACCYRLERHGVFSGPGILGLDETCCYRLAETGECYGGDELMYAGITLPWVNNDFISFIYLFQKEMRPADEGI